MSDMLAAAREWAMLNGPTFLIALVSAIVTFIVGRWVAKMLTRIARRVAERASLDPILVKFVGSLVYALLLTLVIISALGQLGVNTTSFVAVVGAAGLAIGLAFQGTLGNLASGVMLIIFRPFKVGDFVEAGGVSGSVEEVQVFATVLKTPDNKKVIVPNSSITGGSITNYSAHATRRVDLVFGTGYGDDLPKAKQVLTEIVHSHDLVLAEPAPVVAVSELADSSVNFVVRPWVKTADYWTVYFDITEAVKQRFDAEGLSIPFPQRDVHLFKEEAA